MDTYKRLLCVAAEYEVEQLKKSNQEFKLNKDNFDPTDQCNCVYGQVFGSSVDKKAKDFKKSNNLLTGFSNNNVNLSYSVTALEALTELLWLQGKKEQVYSIIEQFATWTNTQPKEPTNLFTFN